MKDFFRKVLEQKHLAWLAKETRVTRSIIKDCFRQMRMGQIHLVAASLSYSSILALVPFLAVVLATFKSIGALEAYAPKVEAMLLMNMREAAGSEATKFIRIFLKNIKAGQLGTTGVIFLGLASMRLLNDMESCIHHIWGLPNTRVFYKRWFYHWLLMVLIPTAFAVYVGLTSIPEFQFIKVGITSKIINYVLLVGLLFLTYKVVPDVKVHQKSALWGALITSGLLVIVQKSFADVTLSLFNISKIYGSFAALPLMLLWVLSIWYVILGGVALTSALERQKFKQQ